MERYVIDDILVGIFAFFPDGKREFHYDRPKIHTFFHQQRSKYPLLRGIGFSTNDTFPESGEIDDAYSNLLLGGILYSIGLDFDPHKISKECKKYFANNVREKFSDEELKDLKELSKEFQAEFSLEGLLS